MKELYNKPESDDETNNNCENDSSTEKYAYTAQQIAEATMKLKNRKAARVNKIPNELIKCGGGKLQKDMLQLFKKILYKRDIPQDWRASITIPILEKRK